MTPRWPSSVNVSADTSENTQGAVHLLTGSIPLLQVLCWRAKCHHNSHVYSVTADGRRSGSPSFNLILACLHGPVHESKKEESDFIDYIEELIGEERISPYSGGTK